jgi:hypothetical protein
MISRKYYESKFNSYPDLVVLKEMRKMLGGITERKALDLLHSKQIKAFYIHDPNEQIVAVAQSQLGNVGGQPYWSWYGFDSRVEWCACFVSWCANECGFIDLGVIP